MEIQTTRFGILSIAEQHIIEMPHGILGFPNQKQFVILEHGKNSPFFWYQSTEAPGIALVITSPYLFMPEYTVDLDGVIKAMSWNGSKPDPFLDVYVVVNIPRGVPEKMSANLIGPIVVNTVKRQAVQIVLTDSPYTHKFYLLHDIKK